MRVRGWMRVDPSWAAREEQAAAAAAAAGGDNAAASHLFVPTLPDPLQPEVSAEAAAERARADAARPEPLAGYYRAEDGSAATASELLLLAAGEGAKGAAKGLAPLRAADLARFDPAARLSSRLNGGEADVCVAAVEALPPGTALPEHRGSVPAAQAAEAGLLPGALARHLLNVSLAASKGSGAASLSRLPPPPPVDRSEAAQWASLTSANADAAAVQTATAVPPSRNPRV